MTIDRAIEILDPEHRECYDGMDYASFFAHFCRSLALCLKSFAIS